MTRTPSSYPALATRVPLEQEEAGVDRGGGHGQGREDLQDAANEIRSTKAAAAERGSWGVRAP
jgi:hypothetical protein